MNRSLLVAVGVVCVAASAASVLVAQPAAPAAPAPPAPPKIELPGLKDRAISELAWMAGSWKGEHDGGTIEEHWMSPAGKTMSGMSRLVVGERTAFHEYLRIKQNADGTIDYLAQPVGRCPATPFRLTKLSANLAVFENPAHDDPKLIRYELKSDGTLSATTEGPGKDGGVNAHETVMKPGTLK